MGIPPSTARTRAAPEPSTVIVPPAATIRYVPKLGGGLFFGEVLIVGYNVQEDTAESVGRNPAGAAERAVRSIRRAERRAAVPFQDALAART
jgi:hypothetical protein